MNYNNFNLPRTKVAGQMNKRIDHKASNAQSMESTSNNARTRGVNARGRAAVNHVAAATNAASGKTSIDFDRMQEIAVEFGAGDFSHLQELKDAGCTATLEAKGAAIVVTIVNPNDEDSEHTCIVSFFNMSEDSVREHLGGLLKGSGATGGGDEVQENEKDENVDNTDEVSEINYEQTVKDLSEKYDEAVREFRADNKSRLDALNTKGSHDEDYNGMYTNVFDTFVTQLKNSFTLQNEYLENPTSYDNFKTRVKEELEKKLKALEDSRNSYETNFDNAIDTVNQYANKIINDIKSRNEFKALPDYRKEAFDIWVKTDMQEIYKEYVDAILLGEQIDTNALQNDVKAKCEDRLNKQVNADKLEADLNKAANELVREKFFYNSGTDYAKRICKIDISRQKELDEAITNAKTEVMYKKVYDDWGTASDENGKYKVVLKDITPEELKKELEKLLDEILRTQFGV